MNEQKLVSVIMPVYNAEKYIAQALESILNQTYTNLEILIADDFSLDKSKQIIDSYADPRIIRYHNDINLGYLKTCNKLFKTVSGEYIAFQDADDWSDLNRIEKTIEFIENNRTIAMCGCNFRRLKENSRKIISESNYPVKDSSIKDYIFNKKYLPFCGASVVIRKTVLNDIGGYKDFYDRIGFEHFDWFLRISEKYAVANIQEHFYYYRYVPNSFSRSDKLYNFKKYFAKDIAWFLKNQRLKYGEDGLGNPELENEFLIYLRKLENEFTGNRKPVYYNVVKNNLSNRIFSKSFKISVKGLIRKEISAKAFFYINYRIFRSILASIIKP